MNLTLEPKDDRPKNALPGKALSGSELMKDRDTSRSFAKHSSTRFSHQPSYTGRSFLPSRNSPSFFLCCSFFCLQKNRDTSCSFAKHSSIRFSHQPSYTGKSFLPSRKSSSFFGVIPFFAYKRTETRPVHLPSIRPSVFLISRHIRESHFSPPENLRPFLELFRFLLTKEQRHVLFICQAFGHPFFSSAVIYGKVISRFQKIFVLFWSYSAFCLQKDRDTSCSFAKHSAIRFLHPCRRMRSNTSVSTEKCRDFSRHCILFLRS